MPKSPLEDPVLIGEVLRNIRAGLNSLREGLACLADACDTATVEIERYAADLYDEHRTESRAEVLSDPWWAEVQKVVEP